MRARHRLSKFLLRAGPRYEQGQAWTVRHMGWLRALSFEDACVQATLVDYLSAIEFGLGRRQALLAALERAVPGCSHAQTIARLRCFRGIETLSAAGLCAELHG